METLKNEIRVSVIPRATVKPSDSNPSSSPPQDRSVRVYADGHDETFGKVSQVTSLRSKILAASFKKSANGKERKRSKLAQQETIMVLWEITVTTVYFVGLKRTYRLALKLQRKIISVKRPKIRQFARSLIVRYGIRIRNASTSILHS
ncbi:hypothetical protein K1719_015937 [Acacia pycnantha]|nr:hypothetical protein K1719_015937 [Acacia pycnantha]